MIEIKESSCGLMASLSRSCTTHKCAADVDRNKPPLLADSAAEYDLSTASLVRMRSEGKGYLPVVSHRRTRSAEGLLTSD